MLKVIPVNYTTASATDVANQLLQIINSGAGNFGIGTVFGGILSYFIYRLAGQERSKRDKLDHERETELLRQLAAKDERIDRLHERVTWTNHQPPSAGSLPP